MSINVSPTPVKVLDWYMISFIANINDNCRGSTKSSITVGNLSGVFLNNASDKVATESQPILRNKAIKKNGNSRIHICPDTRNLAVVVEAQHPRVFIREWIATLGLDTNGLELNSRLVALDDYVLNYKVQRAGPC